ncbi:MAG: uroporphyrinogen-III C-methyltransferase [Chlorobiaceae bacterium]|nr:uroporphyrinogen-III C-methyltransferase [Chlorobiaceae bacterium]
MPAPDLHPELRGRVYLVGAGAGCADCLTLRADAVLKASSIILYDDLIDPSILDRYDAEPVYVGKRKGRHHADQGLINEQLFEAARSPHVVARLKGGDPFIFGRGGEEMVYLLERGIEVDIVPGLSAMQTAAASCGIPLTHRGESNAVQLLNGHHLPFGVSDQTYVYYMCATRLPSLRIALLERGVEPSVPAALVSRAGFHDEAVVMTTVDDLGTDTPPSPLLAIVGRTAGMYRKRPSILYAGKRPWSCLVPGRIVPVGALRQGGKLKPGVELSLFDGIVVESVGDGREVLELFGEIPPMPRLYAYGQEAAAFLNASGVVRIIQPG